MYVHAHVLGTHMCINMYMHTKVRDESHKFPMYNQRLVPRDTAQGIAQSSLMRLPLPHILGWADSSDDSLVIEESKFDIISQNIPSFSEISEESSLLTCLPAFLTYTRKHPTMENTVEEYVAMVIQMKRYWSCVLPSIIFLGTKILQEQSHDTQEVFQEEEEHMPRTLTKSLCGQRELCYWRPLAFLWLALIHQDAFYKIILR